MLSVITTSAVLFIIGSSLFALGSALSLSLEPIITALHINLIFFIGSIFFTSAAYVQLLSSLNPKFALEPIKSSFSNSEFKFFGYSKKDAGYISSLVQFIGTLLFNVDTFTAYLNESAFVIWTPNMLGSIAFMISSIIFLKDRYSYYPSIWMSVSGDISFINMLGSIFFQISALVVIPTLTYSIYLANLTTLLGAICFFIASYIMIPKVEKIVAIKLRINEE